MAQEQSMMRTPAELAKEILRFDSFHGKADKQFFDGLRESIAIAIEQERQHQAKLEAENKNLFDALTTLAMKENKTAMEALAQITPNRSELEQKLSQAEARANDATEQTFRYMKDNTDFQLRALEAEKQLAQLQEENSGLCADHFADLAKIAKLQEENDRLKGKSEPQSCEVGPTVTFTIENPILLLEKPVAQLQLEVGRKDEALQFISDNADVEDCRRCEELRGYAEDGLSHPTPPLYSAVVELVEVLSSLLNDCQQTRGCADYCGLCEHQEAVVKTSLDTLKNLLNLRSPK